MPVRKYGRQGIAWDCTLPHCNCWAMDLWPVNCTNSRMDQDMQVRKDLRADLKESAVRPLAFGFHESGDDLKKDAGKARHDLVPPHFMDELAKLYGIGAAKYEDRGWEKGMKWGRVFAAMLRHAWAFWRGECSGKPAGSLGSVFTSP